MYIWQKKVNTYQEKRQTIQEKIKIKDVGEAIKTLTGAAGCDGITAKMLLNPRDTDGSINQTSS